MLSETMTLEQDEGPIDEGIVLEHSQDVSSVETSRMVEEPSRVVVAETIQFEKLHQLLLPPLTQIQFYWNGTGSYHLYIGCNGLVHPNLVQNPDIVYECVESIVGGWLCHNSYI
jgi:hypothetical protein